MNIFEKFTVAALAVTIAATIGYMSAKSYSLPELSITKTQYPSAASVDTGDININVASSDELIRLPGIGEALAERIIEYRTAKMQFEYPSDIMNVDGIGIAVYGKIKEYICVN